MRNDVPNPSEWMRARRPYLFSDTRKSDVQQLSKSVFEYHLETLTNRKQEYEFEHFCRKLAEKTICPNLRVQTGPTGGGDSKVDTETYPVAKEIAERWWVGSASAGDERWAFAFSAKQDWQSKVKTDVENIISTGRDYKRIYFFTNQFASDKKRATAEDTLSKHTGIPVHIIDRAWITEKVYEDGHLDLAISTLGIEDAQTKKVSHSGPRDAARLLELEELDRQVADQSRYQGARYQLVEDCLRSAILARGLERPRSEVESRFALADRLAQDMNYQPQQLRIAYNRAWTAYWWYEDIPALINFYQEVEKRVEGSVQANEVGLLCNLLPLLTESVASGRINAQEAKIESCRQHLISMLNAIAADPVRLNNALQARTDLVLLQITQSLQNRQLDLIDAGWQELSNIVDESAGLGTYPFERLHGIVTALGDIFDGPAFDAFYEKIADTIRRRRTDGEAGESYTDRGIQKLHHKKPYDAIRLLGRAEELLLKEEYRSELVFTLLTSSYAYEQVGLLWSARNKILATVERSLAVFREDGDMTKTMLRALQRLVWIELQLGRIPHVLSAMEFASIIAAHLKLPEGDQKAFDDERFSQEAVLGIHFLNLPFDALPSVARLPGALERLGLFHARMALLFVLGQEGALREEGYIPDSEDSHAVQAFFELWQDHPAANDISPQPLLANSTSSVLKSTILGSELVVDAPNNAISFGISESILGAIEAFLATSDEDDVMPHCERMTIIVSASDEMTDPPQLCFPDADGRRVEIVHPSVFEFKTAAERTDFMKWIQDCLIQIMIRMLVIPNVSGWLEKIAGKERGFARALGLGDALTLNSNVFGATPRVQLIDWVKPNDKAWPVLRNERWRPEKTIGSNGTAGPGETIKFGAGPPPRDMFDKSRMKHTDRRVSSPIDLPLWDRAKWHATVFAWHPDGPPVLGLVFENGEVGQAIFHAWRERWGNEDKDDALRLAIIRGVSNKNPAEYAVVVGPNLHHNKSQERKTILVVSRINRMTPASTTNLDNFIAQYQKIGAFLLAPAQWIVGVPNPIIHMAIGKRNLQIRQAWQIDENDPDIAALNEDDEPVVPEGVVDPPVVRALAWIRAIRQANRRRP